MNILITGGASGVGLAITNNLAENTSHNIYFTYYHSIDVANQLEKKYNHVKGILCDFKNTEDVQKLCNHISTLNLDILINNAISTSIVKKHFHKLSEADFHDGFLYNILPVIKITQAAITLFRKKKFGKIITILTSAIINKPPLGYAEYAAAKAYIASLSKSWASENAEFNITANCISPAFMKTNLTKDTDERTIENIIEGNPLKKILTTQEVSEAVSYFVNCSQHVNGTNLLINSGSDII